MEMGFHYYRYYNPGNMLSITFGAANYRQTMVFQNGEYRMLLNHDPFFEAIISKAKSESPSYKQLSSTPVRV